MAYVYYRFGGQRRHGGREYNLPCNIVHFDKGACPLVFTGYC